MPSEQILPMAQGLMEEQGGNQVLEFCLPGERSGNLCLWHDSRAPRPAETALCSATHTVLGAALAHTCRSLRPEAGIISVLAHGCVCTLVFTLEIWGFASFFFSLLFFFSSISEKDPEDFFCFLLFLGLKNEKS